MQCARLESESLSRYHWLSVHMCFIEYLQVHDLYSLNEADQSAILVPKWNELWNNAMKGNDRTVSDRSTGYIIADYAERRRSAGIRSRASTRRRTDSTDETPLLAGGEEAYGTTETANVAEKGERSS